MKVLLAIHRDAARSVSRLSLAAPALANVWRSIEVVTTKIRGFSRQKYVSGFVPEEGDALELKLELPDSIARCGRSVPQDVAILTREKLQEWPLAALAFVDTGDAPTFRFQAIDSRNMLAPNHNVVFFNPNGFELASEVGIALSERVDAIHELGKLLFVSEPMVNRFLDLSNFFRQATDKEIDMLFANAIFAPVDTKMLKANASANVRRKLRAVVKRGTLPSVKEIQAIALRVGTEVEVVNGAVVVPIEAKALTTFVRILNDDFLETLDVRKEVYMSSSKRRIRE